MKNAALTEALPLLAIVVPCYQEEEVLPTTIAVLEELLQKLAMLALISPRSYVCFVNDGSKDDTWPLIRRAAEEKPCISGMNLSRNFGHQAALLAGLFQADADVYISLDADLQDDEQKMVEMLELFHQGMDVVYACRDNRDTDSFFKRCTAEAFYKLRSFIGINTIPNHADYRLMSRRAVDELKRFSEVNLFLRGVVPLLGFPSAKVYYKRKSRELGVSKYPLRKMLMLAWNGVVNFTDLPLRLIVLLGMAGFCLSLVLMFWCFWVYCEGRSVPGWASLLAAISIFGSVQLFCTGILGLYLGKIFWECKRRPLFCVQDNLTPQGLAGMSGPA